MNVYNKQQLNPNLSSQLLAHLNLFIPGEAVPYLLFLVHNYDL